MIHQSSYIMNIIYKGVYENNKLLIKEKKL